MSNSKDSVSVGGGGIGFVGALTILFVALKLCGVINWHWVWVLSPIWISILLSLGVIAMFVFIAFGIPLLLAGGIWLYEAYQKRKRRLAREKQQ